MQWSLRYWSVSVGGTLYFLGVIGGGEEVVDVLGKHVPTIKSNLVLLLSGQGFIALQTPEGREVWRESALEKVQAIMN